MLDLLAGVPTNAFVSRQTRRARLPPLKAIHVSKPGAPHPNSVHVRSFGGWVFHYFGDSLRAKCILVTARVRCAIHGTQRPICMDRPRVASRDFTLF